MTSVTKDYIKFLNVHKDPTNQLKSNINKIITANNAQQNSFKLPKITGDYKSRYIYMEPSKAINNIILSNPLFLKSPFPFMG